MTRKRPWAVTRPDAALTALASVVLAVIMFRTAQTVWGTPPFTPDSWSYWEISKHLFSGPFYMLDTFRSYQQTVRVSTSFPPAWPALIWAGQVATGTGPHLMVGLAAGCYTLAGFVLAGVSFRRGFPAAAGPVALIVAFLVFPPLQEEIRAGRSVPLSVLLLTVLLLIWPGRQSRPHRFPFREALCGTVLGMMCLARYDAVPFVAALLLLSTLLFRSWRWRSAAAAVAGAALVLAPWSAWSFQVLRTPWPSDNGVVASAVDPLFVTDIVPVPLRTASDDPSAWLARITVNTADAVGSAAGSLGRSGHLLGLLAAVAVLALIAAHRDRLRGLTVSGALAGAVLRFVLNRPTVAVMVALVSQVLLSEAVTGYRDGRYWSLVVVLAAWWWSAVTLAAVVRVGPRLPRPFWPGLAAVGGLLLGQHLVRLPTVPTEPVSVGYDLTRIAACPHPGTLLYLSARTDAFRIGAQNRIPVAVPPRNLRAVTADALVVWADKFDIRSVFVPTGTDLGYVTPIVTALVLSPGPCAVPGGAILQRPNGPDQTDSQPVPVADRPPGTGPAGLLSSGGTPTS